MPIRFTVTREDILMGQPISPDWYLATISKVWEKPAKGDGSQVVYFEFTINSDGPFKGRKVKTQFSEKAPSFIEGLVVAITNQPFEPGTFDMDGSVGKSCKIKIVNDQYEGRMINKIDGYKSAA